MEDEPRAQHGHLLRIQHPRARLHEHHGLPQHHRPAVHNGRQPLSARITHPHHHIQLPPHVAAQADSARADRTIHQGHQPDSHALPLQLLHRSLRIDAEERERRRRMEIQPQLRPGTRRRFQADEQILGAHSPLQRIPDHRGQQRPQRRAGAQPSEEPDVGRGLQPVV